MSITEIQGTVKDIFIKFKMDKETNKFIYLGEEDNIEAVLIIDANDNCIVVETGSDIGDIVTDFEMFKIECDLIENGDIPPTKTNFA